MINAPVVFEGKRLEVNAAANATLLASAKGGGTIIRHDLLLRLICSVMRRGPFVVRMEDPHILPQARVDILYQLISDERRVIADPTVVTPFAESYSRQAMSNTLSAALLRYDRKVAKYQEKAEAAGCDFTPLPFEVFGGMPESTLSFIRTLARRVEEVAPYQPVNWAASHHINYLTQRISVLLTRETAHMCLDALKRVDHPLLTTLHRASNPQDSAIDITDPHPLPRRRPRGNRRRSRGGGSRDSQDGSTRGMRRERGRGRGRERGGRERRNEREPSARARRGEGVRRRRGGGE